MTLLFDQEYARKMELLNERKEARVEGADNLSYLLQKLYTIGKSDDAQKVIYDSSFRSKLMAEYGLT